MRRSDVQDSYLMLGFLSGELAARAAERATSNAVEELRDLDAQVQRLAPDQGPEAQRLNFLIHARIASAADSPRLSAFVSHTTRFVPRHFWHVVPGWDALNRADHRPVIDAIAAREPDAAREQMSAHIARAAALLIGHLDATGFWAEPDEMAA
jgi:DNA-binding GntR family transcriptional regulator